MGRQYNKKEKRLRRARYLKRKRLHARQTAKAPAAAASAPTAETPAA
jgi:hypothetical protein